MGAPASPRAEKKIRRNSHTKILSTPQHSKYTPRRCKSQVLVHFLLCRENLELELMILDRLLEATTKKVHRLLKATSGKGSSTL